MRSLPAPRLLLILPTTTYRATAFVEAASRLGIALTVASESDSALQRAAPANLLTLDFARPERAEAEARRFAQEYPLAAVVGVDDETAELAARIARALNLEHNPVESVRAAGDKLRQRQRLSDAGIPVPGFLPLGETEDADQLAGRVRYPCVVKPLGLSASRGVIRADTPSALRAAVRRARRILDSPDLRRRALRRELLVEDFIPGAEVALEGLVRNGRLHLLALFDKPDEMTGPFFEETIYVTPSRHPPETQAALVACGARAAAALGLREGPVHAELRWHDGKPWLIELAARPIGGRCGESLRFGPAGGQTLEEVVLAAALGRLETVPALAPGGSGVMMLPIPRSGIFREVRGMEAALAVPGITGLSITAHPGQRFATLPEESKYLGFLFARGDAPGTVERALRAAHGRLEIVMD